MASERETVAAPFVLDDAYDGVKLAVVAEKTLVLQIGGVDIPNAHGSVTGAP